MAELAYVGRNPEVAGDGLADFVEQVRDVGLLDCRSLAAPASHFTHTLNSTPKHRAADVLARRVDEPQTPSWFVVQQFFSPNETPQVFGRNRVASDLVELGTIDEEVASVSRLVSLGDRDHSLDEWICAGSTSVFLG